MKQRDIPEFQGFVGKNSVAVPDALFDHLLGLLTGAELKVLLYIIRRTQGFHKWSDTISLSQFQEGIITKKDGRRLDYGCGVRDRQTIIEALASLETKNCIVIEKGETQTSPITYTIFFSYELVDFSNQQEQQEDTTSRENPPHWLGKPTSTSRNFPTALVGKPNIQETVLQETVLQEEGVIREEQETPSSLKKDAVQQEPTKGDTPIPTPTMKRDTFIPSTSKTFKLAESKKSSQPIPLFPKEKDRDPRSMTAREQKRLEEQERAAYWSLAERVLKANYRASFRDLAVNQEGLHKLIADKYTLEEVEQGLDRLTVKEKNRFNWMWFLEWLPNKLSGSYEEPGQENKKGEKDPRRAGLVYWADQWMTEAEADELGFNGGFNQYVMVPPDDDDVGGEVVAEMVR